MAELDRIDRLHGLGAMSGAGPVRRRAGGVAAPLAGLAVTALVLGLVVLVSPANEFRTVRRLLGLGPERPAVDVDAVPGSGSYAFLLTQHGSQEPVGYDPCQTLEYVVNPAGAPDDWEDLVETSVVRTAAATGLTFDDEGTTDRRPFDPGARAPFSGTTAPVVIGFSDAAEIPGLAGDVAGLGGSLASRGPLGRDYYVTGAIALDVDVFDDQSMATDRASLQAILDHELGHVVGLDHVADPGELMHGQSLGRTTYGPGDREGLARLGSIPCS